MEHKGELNLKGVVPQEVLSALQGIDDIYKTYLDEEHWAKWEDIKLRIISHFIIFGEDKEETMIKLQKEFNNIKMKNNES